MPSPLAEVTRGGAVESVHHGVVAVVDVSGAVVASVGDVDHFAYFRSCAKPFQAVPLVESGAADAFALTPSELALCCASHHGTPRHQAEVAAMLARIGLDERALGCGVTAPIDEAEAARVAAGLVSASPLQCDCSGKHAGMLATCLHLGLPIGRYLEPDHPLQQTVLSVVAALLRLPPKAIRPATDGCSLPTFGGSLRAFATAYASLACPEAAPPLQGRQHAAALQRLREAMASNPENVAGPDSLVADVITLSEGAVVAKSGAEGLLCLAIPKRGLGIAIKILDGAFRAHSVVAGRLFEELGLVPPDVISALRERHDPRLLNPNGRHVGDLRASFELSRR